MFFKKTPKIIAAITNQKLIVYFVNFLKMLEGHSKIIMRSKNLQKFLE